MLVVVPKKGLGFNQFGALVAFRGAVGRANVPLAQQEMEELRLRHPVMVHQMRTGFAKAELVPT